MNAKVAVVISCHGSPELTHAVIRELTEQGDPHQVIINDNAGDYRRCAGEIVLCSGTDLGWLGGTNNGVSAALLDDSFDYVCMLNNDVTLSAGFLAGLVDAARQSGAGLIAPCYDDQYPQQTSYYTGAARDFVAEPVESPTDVVDGTCMLVPVPVLREVGPMDERHFGLHGWGGADDLCLRIMGTGLSIMVTRRAYLQHSSGATLNRLHSDYRRLAWAEMVVGMRHKYGRNWPSLFPHGTFDHNIPNDHDYLRSLKITYTDRMVSRCRRATRVPAYVPPHSAIR